MQWWLMKSEPEKFSYADLEQVPEEPWDGVRNHQAQANMRAMQVGDRAFFYHSVKEKAIIGIMTICQPWRYDPAYDDNPKFGHVYVRALSRLPRPVTLAAIKAEPQLQAMAMLRQSRLSVAPVTAVEAALLQTMGGL